MKITQLIINQEKWMEALSLKYNWEHAYSPIISLTLALATLSDQMENGYFIGKQEFIIKTHPSSRKDLLLNGKVKMKKHINNMDYLICQSEVLENENALVDMHTTLIKTNQQLNKKTVNVEDNGEFCRPITKNQVHKFSELSGDPNSIHQGDDPVVQGMLLLLLIEDYLAMKNRFIKRGKITYLAPVKADCRLILCWESAKELSGIINNIKYFTLTIEEEFTC